MTSPSNRPRPVRRPRNRLFDLLPAGLALAVLAAVYLVINLILDDTSDAEADFATATCADFDLASFAALSGGAAERSTANADLYPDPDMHGLSCQYTSGSGMTLTITAATDTSEAYWASSLEMTRQAWETEFPNAIKDFDNGDFVGFTFSRATESKQLFDLHAAADRLVVSVVLEAEPGGFETDDALVVAETMGGQVFERFKEYV